ncbi:MAG: hypothetical protein OXF54_02750 [Caldilineaceae bacterium]|nr:hypothetical protein [Caldilineaceae bacterium]
MTDGIIPLERILFGNEHWRSHRAINEIEIYCELLEHLQDKIDALETSQTDEKATLIDVQSVISSYAIEIAMKSLRALDYPDKRVPPIHDLVEIFDDLKEGTKRSLEDFQLTREALEEMPKPFTNNRYSMEFADGRLTTVYPVPLLRALTRLLTDKLEENRKALLTSPRTYTA